MPPAPAPRAADPTPVSAARVDDQKAHAQANATLPIWNPSSLTELVGDNPGMHRRLLDKFLINAKKQVDQIQQAAQINDTNTLADTAHTLKSAARSVGTLALGELCQNLEAAGRAGDASHCSRLAQEAATAVNSVTTKIRDHLNR
jgi:HPt (histidine-containing phosphotransfer) domain-containing protein